MFSIIFSFSTLFYLIKLKIKTFFNLIYRYILKINLLYYLNNSFNTVYFIKIIIKKIKSLYISLNLIKIIKSLRLIK